MGIFDNRNIKVTSSNLRTVLYDPDEKILEVEFKSGKIYAYFEVPQDVFAELLTADSPGKYFYHNIRSAYEYSYVD